MPRLYLCLCIAGNRICRLARWGSAGLIAKYKLDARVVLFDEAEVLAFVQGAKINKHQSLHSNSHIPQ